VNTLTSEENGTAAGNANLLKLADILDAADALHAERGEPSYDQTQFAHPCGTPACALGHWGHANPETWKFQSMGWWRHINAGPNHHFDGAELDFALDACEASELFSMWGCAKAETAKAAADYIRAFVARRPS
jgi:hypothetical protein